MPKYKVEYAPELSVELNRLENGTVPEVQRYNNVTDAIFKVRSDPLSGEFVKQLPDEYKTVDVLQQYRLFFKIIKNNNDDKTDTIYFVWINDEDSIHRIGKPNDCYKIFTKLVSKGEIAEYQPPAVFEKKKLVQIGIFDIDIIVSFKWGFKLGDDVAKFYLQFNAHDEIEYRMDILANPGPPDMTREFIKSVCDKLDENKIDIFYEPMQPQIDHDILHENKFRIELEEGDEILWVRKFKK